MLVNGNSLLKEQGGQEQQTLKQGSTSHAILKKTPYKRQGMWSSLLEKNKWTGSCFLAILVLPLSYLLYSKEKSPFKILLRK